MSGLVTGFMSKKASSGQWPLGQVGCYFVGKLCEWVCGFFLPSLSISAATIAECAFEGGAQCSLSLLLAYTQDWKLMS